MNVLYILRGLPGSGKSYMASQIAMANKEKFPVICSTDHYWIRPDGRYDWNFKLIGEAHEWNFKRTKEFFDQNIAIIILDNTNVQFKDFSKYIELALKHRYQIELVEPPTTWKFDAEICAKRNQHNVPLDSIKKMLDRWETTDACNSRIEGLSGLYG